VRGCLPVRVSVSPGNTWLEQGRERHHVPAGPSIRLARTLRLSHRACSTYRGWLCTALLNLPRTQFGRRPSHMSRLLDALADYPALVTPGLGHMAWNPYTRRGTQLRHSLRGRPQLFMAALHRPLPSHADAGLGTHRLVYNVESFSGRGRYRLERAAPSRPCAVGFSRPVSVPGGLGKATTSTTESHRAPVSHPEVGDLHLTTQPVPLILRICVCAFFPIPSTDTPTAYVACTPL